MLPPTRTEFLKSRLYRCALAFTKRNDLRMKHIQDLLEKVDEKQKRNKSSATKKYTSSWILPDCDDKSIRHRSSKEDDAIISSEYGETSWVYDKAKNEYSLEFGGVTVMKLPSSMYSHLKSFQRDAVKWIAGVGPTGGILGDDMGLGKTIMAIASIGARANCNRIRMVLVVAPVSVLGAWAAEAKNFLPKFSIPIRVVKVHGGTKKDRAKTLRNAWKDSSIARPFVIISSWGLVCDPKSMSAFLPPAGHHWDYVFLDEAHVIKNHSSKRASCCKRICHKPGTKRLLLTGTPFQNDTNELWSMVHMATGGKVLGKKQDFNKKYGKPIRDGRDRNASSYAIKQGQEANAELQEMMKPFMLRRLKEDVLDKELPPKREICVWVKPSCEQKRLYQDIVAEKGYLAKKFTSSDKAEAKKAIFCAFQVIESLRSLCGHPLRLAKGGSIRETLEQTDLTTIIGGSRKMELVVHMINGFTSNDHKTLLFSESTQNLDVIEHVLRKQGNIKICRIDGSVSEKYRQDIVGCFQDGLVDLLLLSTGAGGVGLTLTRASRVIIFDPSWNPSKDAQAVDRAYRISQVQEVLVYRLFIAGSIEEKMYGRQVHKSGLEKDIFGKGKSEERHFDKNELCKVFAQIPDGRCELLDRFKTDGIGQVDDIRRHDLVRAHSSVIGISNHSNIYGKKRKGAFSDATGAVAKHLKQTSDEALKNEKAVGFVSEKPKTFKGNHAGANTVVA